ncbi:hypothetical protein V2G26_007308 [Clonostachys chloroleuca]
MSSPNPLSIPGGWKKDTPRDTPAAEKPDPTETIPRSATGLVSDSGEIIDHEGKTIGMVADSEDSRSLVGKTVTATGEVINQSGDILGRASLEYKERGYTTQGQEACQKAAPQAQEAEKAGGGASGFLSSTSSVFKQGLGLTSRSKESDSETGHKSTPPNVPVTEKAEAAVQETRSEAPGAPSEIQGAASEVQDELHTQAGESQKDLPSQASDAPSKAPKDFPIAAGKSQMNVPSKVSYELQTQAGESQKKDIPSQAPSAPSAPSESQDDLLSKSGDEEKGELGEAPVQLEDRDKKDDLKITVDKTDVNLDEAKSLGGETQLDEGAEQVEQAKDTAQEGVPTGIEGDEVGGQEQKAEEEEDEGEKLDYSLLKDAKVNKVGNLVNSDGNVVGRVVQGIIKQLQGRQSDEEGNIWNESGKVVGKADPLSQADREGQKDFAPFENFPDAIVEADGNVVFNGQKVGTVVEGDPKRLKGSKVDEDGDILDRNGNVMGKAEAWDEPEPIAEEVVDRSILAGKRVNKAGNVVDSAGTLFGRVVEGNVFAIIGRMCDKEGNVRNEAGDIVGKAEVVPEAEREGSKEGLFAELFGLTITKDGKVVTPSNVVVGRLIKGDPKVLYGRSVDEDGEVVDKNGNVLGKAERWEEPEEEKKKGPLAGRKVNREGNIVDEDGNIVAKLISGDIMTCSGKEIDDDGDVINAKGNTVGHVALLEDIPPEPEQETEEEKQARLEEQKAKEEAERERKLAGQLGACIEQSLDKIRPLCNLITSKIDSAEKTPKEDLDEEQLVREVRPLIEEGGKILSETNGIIRGLDPDGRIQRQSKQRAGTKEASPEEHHLAEQLKELTGTISQTIDNAKRKIEGMPHAKKELNPLWGLLMNPLGQIIAGVGLLLSGVLGLVGQLLGGLGLGGLVDTLLGGLGLNKVLSGLGLGSAYDALVGKDKKK